MKKISYEIMTTERFCKKINVRIINARKCGWKKEKIKESNEQFENYDKVLELVLSNRVTAQKLFMFTFL